MARTVATIMLAAATTTVLTATPAGAAVTPVPGDPLAGSGNTGRTGLFVSDLTTGSSTGLVDDAHFALPTGAAAPAHTFEGTLALSTGSGHNYQMLEDHFNFVNNQYLDVEQLPPISIQLVQNGSHLIPVRQGLVITGHSTWNLITGPGRAWKESGDGSTWSRAALPFALVQRNANCTHNGTMMFLFNATSVSKVRYQITQETCYHHKFNAWGQLSATYTRQVVSNAEAHKNAHATEVGARLPTKKLDQLPVDYPNRGINIANYGINVGDKTAYGVLYNGVNYIGGCATRKGSYPFCEQMRLPSYSTAKSAMAGTAYMRLGQKFNDPNLGNRLVRTYVTEVQGKSSWNNVTINHTLDMATGHYDDPGYQVDEAAVGGPIDRFFIAETYRDKMTNAVAFPSKTTPGTRFVYHTSDTFIATRAMQNYAGTDLFNLMVSEVYQPAKLSKGALTSLRTDNGSGMAFGGYGMFFTQDDIAKLTKLLNNDGGAAGGAQRLHPDLLADAMQRDPNDRGLDTPGSAVPFKYNNHFWARQFNSTVDPVYTCGFWVPFMSGYGGISVAMMPNGATYYHFSDAGAHTWQAAVKEAAKLGAHC